MINEAYMISFLFSLFSGFTEFGRGLFVTWADSIPKLPDPGFTPRHRKLPFFGDLAETALTRVRSAILAQLPCRTFVIIYFALHPADLLQEPAWLTVLVILGECRKRGYI